MKLLDVVHPAAKTLVDISLSQDAEVSKVRLNFYGTVTRHFRIVTLTLIEYGIVEGVLTVLLGTSHPQGSSCCLLLR